MEKNMDMQQKKMTDDELEQVSGGRSLWGVFTTEFVEMFDGPEAKKLPFAQTEDENLVGTQTLEMRVNPLQDKERKNSRKVVKL